MAQEREIFAIQYYNGEQYDDMWVGIAHQFGVFDKFEMANDVVKKLQIAHDERIEKDIEDGFVYPSFEAETWTVVPIKYTY